jgi:hypothetical protein
MSQTVPDARIDILGKDPRIQLPKRFINSPTKFRWRLPISLIQSLAFEDMLVLREQTEVEDEPLQRWRLGRQITVFVPRSAIDMRSNRRVC